MRNNIVRSLCALLICATLPIARGASAQSDGDAVAGQTPTVRFGKPNQLTISSDASITVQRRTQSGVGGAVTTIMLAPAADYFVLENFSVGGFVGLEYSKTGDTHASRFSVGPRVGYNIWLGKHWSAWPKLGFSYAFTGTSRADNQNAVSLNVFAPIVYHPVPHFFFGLGPFVDTDLNGDHRATVWGVKLTVGGWL